MLLEAGRLPGLGLEAGVELGRVFGEAREVRGRAQLADQPGGVPGGAGGQLLALQQHHVAPAELGQMIGDRAADHAAADDHGLRLARQILGHHMTSPGHRACSLRPPAVEHGRAGGPRASVTWLRRPRAAKDRDCFFRRRGAQHQPQRSTSGNRRLPERQVEAARQVFEHFAKILDAPFSLRLWDGTHGPARPERRGRPVHPRSRGRACSARCSGGPRSTTCSGATSVATSTSRAAI